MADRVRMTAKTVFHNPLIETHLAEGEVRAQAHTVQDGDEFSTSEDHAAELERAGFAERSRGRGAPASDRALAMAGFQTTAAAGAISAAAAAEKAAAEKAAAEKAAAEKERENKMRQDGANKSA